MGNTSSSTSNPTWERYIIQRVEKSPYSIKFFLDRDVKYSGEYSNIVNCDRAYPYYDIHAGDLVEVNWYRSEDYSSSHEFTSSDNLVSIRFREKLREYAAAVPNSSGRELYRVNNLYRASSDNFFENLFSLGELMGSGEIILEKRTEWRGNTEIEYIKKVRFTADEVEYKIETRHIHHAY